MPGRGSHLKAVWALGEMIEKSREAEKEPGHDHDTQSSCEDGHPKSILIRLTKSCREG
jgi:hypothetical protein